MATIESVTDVTNHENDDADNAHGYEVEKLANLSSINGTKKFQNI